MEELNELFKLIKKFEIDKDAINSWIIDKGFSTHDFNAKFKAKYKTTPQKLWKTIRIKKAVKVYHKTWSISKVSELCHYKNNNEFYMDYKRTYNKPWNSKKEKIKTTIKKIVLIILIVVFVRMFYLNSFLCQETSLRTSHPGVFWEGTTTIEVTRTCK